MKMDATRRALVRRAEVFMRAEERLAQQRNARDEAVRTAFGEGVGATEIAALTGLSRPYVYMLVNREPVVHRPSPDTYENKAGVTVSRTD